MMGSTVRKTDLQGAFNEFGHIVQIETPKPGLAFVVFKEKGDAREALEEMDGKKVNGMNVQVSWAGPKPPSNPRSHFNSGETPVSEQSTAERGSRREVLTTTNFERDFGKGSESKPHRERERSKRSRSASRQRERHRGDRRRSRSRSR